MTARNGVQSIDRAVAILRCFDAHHSPLGITEIARMTGLSTSTTHRLLGAMTANRLLGQGPDRRYRPGPLLVQLGRSGPCPRRLQEAALPVHDGAARRGRRDRQAPRAAAQRASGP